MLSPSFSPTRRLASLRRDLPPIDLLDDPALGVAHLLAGGLLEICGPFFWAVLVGGFLLAEFALD
jgi:hypothetical protein